MLHSTLTAYIFFFPVFNLGAACNGSFHFQDHESPALAALFDEALPRVVEILAKFNESHPLIAHFNTHFEGKPRSERMDPHIRLSSNSRARGSSATLRWCTLASPNSTSRKKPTRPGVIPLPNQMLKTHALAKRMLKFNNAHTIYGPDYRPPTFRRDEPSQTATTATIPSGSKRRRGEESGDEPPSKASPENISHVVLEGLNGRLGLEASTGGSANHTGARGTAATSGDACGSSGVTQRQCDMLRQYCRMQRQFQFLQRQSAALEMSKLLMMLFLERGFVTRNFLTSINFGLLLLPAPKLARRNSSALFHVGRES
ncbi:hypothetical protein DFH09DRAFT_1105482 [Mycena vulgaris]|nr:hypothetical protein DFH09DRAFT_1105482 [Mycena vulgaris]